ncbi:hypothetical protein [Tetragenococcus halophilus]|uniref:hypothetical protein n=1 Tax=Tetragenococcus halophilus TaxID=51669 RepID=UPI0030F2AA95
MLMHEEFYRCPECDHPYFKVETHYLLDKKVMETENVASPYQSIRRFKCTKCGTLIESDSTMKDLQE